MLSFRIATVISVILVFFASLSIASQFERRSGTFDIIEDSNDENTTEKCIYNDRLQVACRFKRFKIRNMNFLLVNFFTLGHKSLF